jgi:hypothetical protein
MMAIRRAKATPPPLTRAQLWRVFLRNAVGIPLAILAGLAIIGGALWLTGGDVFWRTISDMGTALFWIGAIALMYPALLVLWIVELRDGLRKAPK